MCLAVPAKITKRENGAALVDFGGVKKKISLGIIDDVAEGDYVLIHAGFAIGKIEREEALDTLKILKELREATKGT